MCGKIIAQRIRYAPSSVTGIGGQRQDFSSMRSVALASSGVPARSSASSGVFTRKRTTYFAASRIVHSAEEISQ